MRLDTVGQSGRGMIGILYEIKDFRINSVVLLKPLRGQHGLMRQRKSKRLSHVWKYYIEHVCCMTVCFGTNTLEEA